MKIFLEKKDGVIDKNNFDDLMNSLRIYDKLFIDNIFKMFDDNKKNEINIKEIILGLSIFRPSNFVSKMNGIYKIIYSLVIIELCDDTNSGFINPEEFLKILKLYISIRTDLKNINNICNNHL